MVAASNQKHLNTIPTVGIVVIDLYIAAQLLSDIANLKITLILIRIPFLKASLPLATWVKLYYPKSQNGSEPKPRRPTMRKY
jgi:hypothetical protein